MNSGEPLLANKGSTQAEKGHLTYEFIKRLGCMPYVPHNSYVHDLLCYHVKVTFCYKKHYILLTVFSNASLCEKLKSLCRFCCGFYFKMI